MADNEEMVVRWLPPDLQPPHPWGDLEILDVRSFALTMISTTTSILLAQNAASWSNDTGSSFIGQHPLVRSGQGVSVFTFDPPLRYLLENKDYMAEGVILTPKEMENKWAIFYYNNQLIFVRSWTREVHAVVDCRVSTDGYLELTQLHGTLAEDEDEEGVEVSVNLQEKASLDFMVRALILGQVSPAPMPPSITRRAREDPMVAAQWCFSWFGRDALFATPLTTTTLSRLPAPRAKLASISLLHIAVVSGDFIGATQQLEEKGVPVDLLADDGAPMHWTGEIVSLAHFKSMVNLLLAHNAQIDVKARDDDTLLGKLVQKQSLEMDELLERLDFILSKGADVNAKQSKGFTPLHRASEMGRLEIVEWLLKAGADINAEALGYTPVDLANMRGHTEIIELLNSTKK